MKLCEGNAKNALKQRFAGGEKKINELVWHVIAQRSGSKKNRIGETPISNKPETS
jgi:hypothetical protein